MPDLRSPNHATGRPSGHPGNAVCPAARAHDREHSVREALRGPRSDRRFGPSFSEFGSTARPRRYRMPVRH